LVDVAGRRVLDREVGHLGRRSTSCGSTDRHRSQPGLHAAPDARRPRADDQGDRVAVRMPMGGNTRRWGGHAGRRGRRRSLRLGRRYSPCVGRWARRPERVRCTSRRVRDDSSRHRRRGCRGQRSWWAPELTPAPAIGSRLYRQGRGAAGCKRSRATILDCQGSQASPARGIHLHSGGEPRCRIEGFTIRSGHASDHGAGILLVGASPRITAAS